MTASDARIYACRPGNELSALRGLLAKTLSSGHRALVQTEPEILEVLDKDLWLGGEGVFLPHGRMGEAHSDRQPILLTDGTELHTPSNGAHFLFQYLTPQSPTPSPGTFARNFVVLQEGDSVRSVVDSLAGLGYEVSLWRQEDSGRWHVCSEG